MKAVHEHEFEAAHGLPEALPAGEKLLWQGSPDWHVLAREVLHLRKLALYFGLLLGWRVAISLDAGNAWSSALWGALPLTVLAAACLGMLAALGWLMGRTSVYTITNHRVVMRVGIVLTVTFNLPFTRIQAAGLRAGRDGHGDITLSLARGDQIAYVHLWPHARPWHLKRTEPMLRALPQAQAVAQLLSRVLAEAAAQPQVVPGRASNDATHADPRGLPGQALAA